MSKDFCHLHVHDYHSILDGVSTPAHYVDRAKDLGFKYQGITNHGNINSVIEHKKECDRVGIIPVFGCEMYVVPNINIKEKGESRSHICLFVKNHEGWKNLLKLLTIANIDGFYFRPRVDYDLLRNNLNGLIISTACTSSFINNPEGMDFLYDAIDIIKDDVYLEIMPLIYDKQKSLNKRIAELHKKNNIKVIATNDCHYCNKDDNFIQEVLLAIQSKAKWSDKNRWKFSIDDLYLKSYSEMIESFSLQGVLNRRFVIESLSNTIDLAEKCSEFVLQRYPVDLPLIKGMEGNPDDILAKMCRKKFREKRNEFFDTDLYLSRMNYELKLIRDKNFSNYFLIVWEITDWCRKNNILTGIGRGSVSGSLIAYLLGITNVDSIKWNLMFERFISPGRKDFPDIDLDIEDTKRDILRQHLSDLYGEYNVANISTFLQIKDRMAIRDVGRVFEINSSDIDMFANSLRGDENIDWAVENTEEGKQFYQKYSNEVEIAKKLSGKIRGVGSHAAGIVISKEKIIDGGKANLIKNKEISINWDKKDAEYMGMLKIDILGLSNLSIVNECISLIKKNKNIDVDIKNISFDDEKIFEEFSLGNCTGCFQFNTKGLRSFCKRLKIEKFETLIHATALYRPAIIKRGLLDEFIIRKKNQNKIFYKHNKINDVLGSTYGIILYQEQLMRIVTEVALMDFVDADSIRKMFETEGTKNIEKYESKFINGCIKNGVDKKEAINLWEYLKFNGGYGFNLAHATAYTMLSYIDMWLKVNYPMEFMCAFLSMSPDDKKEEIIKEAIRMNVKIEPPTINISDSKKWIIHNQSLYMPFIEIKGIGEKTAEKIVKRKNKDGFFNNVKIDNLISDVANGKGVFSFNANNFNINLMPNLKNNFVDVDKNNLTDLVSLDKKIRDNLKSFIVNKKIEDKKLICKLCNLRNECDRPVNYKHGLRNIMICGEAPSKIGYKYNVPFYGDIAKNFLKQIEKSTNMSRNKFHITNVCKCFPSKSRKPSKENIKQCGVWLEEEINLLKPILILAVGNSSLYFFENLEKGIIDKNASTTWNEKYGCWICWSVHPGMIARDNSKQYLIDDSINNFSEKIKILTK